MSMQERIGYIKLSNWPFRHSGKRKDNPNCGWFDDWTERLVIINSRLLHKPFSNQPSFVTLNISISFPFNPETPFIAHNICVWRAWNQLPCFILQKSINFTLHCLSPLIMGLSLIISLRFRRQII